MKNLGFSIPFVEVLHLLSNLLGFKYLFPLIFKLSCICTPVEAWKTIKWIPIMKLNLLQNFWNAKCKLTKYTCIIIILKQLIMTVKKQFVRKKVLHALVRIDLFMYVFWFLNDEWINLKTNRLKTVFFFKIIFCYPLEKNTMQFYFLRLFSR